MHLGPAWHICPRSRARPLGSGIYTCSWNYSANAVFFLRAAFLLSINCWFLSFQAHLFAVYLDASFRSLPWGNWSFVELFELPVANISKTTYHDIRNLCWGVFSSKQTLPFAPASITTHVGSNQLPIPGDSTSLCAQTWDLWHSTKRCSASPSNDHLRRKPPSAQHCTPLAFS